MLLGFFFFLLHFHSPFLHTPLLFFLSSPSFCVQVMISLFCYKSNIASEAETVSLTSPSRLRIPQLLPWICHFHGVKGL